MTANDHANTVRQPLERELERLQAHMAEAPAEVREAALLPIRERIAALDALQTQAETAAEVVEQRNGFYDRLQAAEAERDELRRRWESLKTGYDKAEAERDHARDALRQIENMEWSSLHVNEEMANVQEIARAALGKEPPAADPDLVRHWNPS